MMSVYKDEVVKCVLVLLKAHYSSPNRNENSSKCPLRVLPAPGGKLLFVCHLDKTQMFVGMEIQVHRDQTLIHKRSLLIELVCE